METQEGRSIPELTKDVAFHLGDMFRNELKLARVEATEGVKSLGGGIGKIAAGAVIGTSALTVALLAVAFGLSAVMPMWAAGAVVALTAALFAWSLIRSGQKALTAHQLTLPKTREQVGRDVEAIKDQVH
jgi:hypothetical protein